MYWLKIDRAFAMALGTPNPAYLDTLLKWIAAGAGAGGAVVVGTFVRNWITNKMRDYEDRKKAHLEELKAKVLSPIRESLSHNFSASVSLRAPLLAVQWTQLEFDERARVTEEPAADGEVLVAPFPTTKVFGPIHVVLLEDARKNHFPKLIARIDRFLLSEWSVYLGDWHSWASSVTHEILKRSGLEAYPPKQPRQGPGPKPYVMHYLWSAKIPCGQDLGSM